MRTFVVNAIDQLCVAFERNGYNPTPIVDLGVLVASADGKVGAKERAILLEVFQALLDTTLTAELVDHLVTASLEVIEAAGAESRARLVSAILSDCDAVEPGVRVALAVAFACDGLSAAEKAAIARIADAGGMTAARLEELTREVETRAKAEGEDPISVRQSLVPQQRKSLS